MDKYRETFKTWDKVAELYQDKFMDLGIYNHTYDFFSASIQPSNPGVLDLGCGPGNISKYLLAKRPDLNIHGVDIAPNMVELARNNNPQASYEIIDVREIDQLVSTFDGIICGFCIPYLSESDVDKLFMDCNNLLNEDGILYISFVEGRAGQSGYITAISGVRVYFYFHTLKVIRSHFIKNNFKEVMTFKVPFENNEIEKDTHTIIILKKE